MAKDYQYADKDGHAVTRQEVHQLPAKALAERSPVPLVILPDREALYDTSTVDMDALVASCGNRSAVPPFAVTIGPHDVLRARRTEAVFFAGRFRRFALREVLFRQPTIRFPGTLLKLRKQADGRLVPQDVRVWATPEEAGSVTSRTI